MLWNRDMIIPKLLLLKTTVLNLKSGFITVARIKINVDMKKANLRYFWKS